MKKLIAYLMAFSVAVVPAGTAFAGEQVSEEAVEAVSEAAFAAEEDFEEGYEYEDIFSSWNPDAPALKTLIDYVEAVTDENSEDFIPPVDRIATFDMDGTLYAELFPTYLEYYMLAWRILKDPSIDPDSEMLSVGRALRDCALDKSFPEDMPLQHAIQAARAYAGLTLNEFADFVTGILLRDADGFEGMTYGEAFYVPMIEVIDYLNENNFKVYVCSGSDRFICRTLLEGMVDVPGEKIIGMDVALEAANQGDTDGLDYVYQENDEMVRTDTLLIKNIKMNKVVQIAKEIGRQPVLSFGNTSGDVSMHNYTIFDNPYRSAAFMLIADDEERDYGDTEKAQELREKWEESGYNVISMKDDFLTIYGEDVVKTGSFHWLDELAEERIPSDQKDKGTGVAGVVGSIIEEGGKLIDMIGGLFSGAGREDASAGTDDEDNAYESFVMLDDEVYETSKKAVEEYNKEFLDEGDVQLVTNCVAKNVIVDENTVRQLGMFTQQNFAADGSDLKCIDEARDAFLITQTKNEDGTYSVTGVEKAEDGDNDQESLAAMCSEVGITVEEFAKSTAEMELWEIMSLVVYMNNHPETERIEYNGEMLTLDELAAIRDEMEAVMYG